MFKKNFKKYEAKSQTVPRIGMSTVGKLYQRKIGKSGEHERTGTANGKRLRLTAMEQNSGPLSTTLYESSTTSMS
jgi:hypothetical protein